MKKFVFVLICMGLLFSAQAQEWKEWEIPKNYTFESQADNEKYEEDVKKCVDWLMFTPMNEQTTKRKLAASFLTSWIASSEKVSIMLNEDILTFRKTSPELVPVFMAGYLKHAIQSDEPDNRLEGNVEGLKAVMVFYNKNKQIMGKDKAVEKLMKMYRKDQFHNFVKEQLRIY